MSMLGVWLGKRKTEWDEYANQLGYSASTLAAKVLKRAMDFKVETQPVFTSVPKKEWGKKKTLNLRLTESEMQALVDCAKYEGMSKQRFMVGVLRAYIANECQYSTDEVLALRESNTQLRKLGVNVNLIVRHLNAQDSSLAISFEKVATKLTRDIKAHTEVVVTLLGSSEQRWQLVRKDLNNG